MIAAPTEGVELRREASVRRVLASAFAWIDDETRRVLTYDWRTSGARVTWSPRGDMIVTLPARFETVTMRMTFNALERR